MAGLIGAATVAGFFFVVDYAQGQPLGTPSALGAALFLGEVSETGGPPRLLLVVAYTAVHGATFAAVALPAALYITARGRRLGPGFLALLALVLFAAIELVFLGFDAVFAPDPGLATGQVGAANLVAAIFMTLGLALWGRRHL